MLLKGNIYIKGTKLTPFNKLPKTFGAAEV